MSHITADNILQFPRSGAVPARARPAADDVFLDELEDGILRLEAKPKSARQQRAIEEGDLMIAGAVACSIAGCAIKVRRLQRSIETGNADMALRAARTLMASFCRTLGREVEAKLQRAR